MGNFSSENALNVLENVKEKVSMLLNRFVDEMELFIMSRTTFSGVSKLLKTFGSF